MVSEVVLVHFNVKRTGKYCVLTLMKNVDLFEFYVFVHESHNSLTHLNSRNVLTVDFPTIFNF